MSLEKVNNAGGTYIEAVKPTIDEKSLVANQGSTSVDIRKNQENPFVSNEQQRKGDQVGLRAAVSEANLKLKGSRTGCEFTYHEKTNQVSIKVYDMDTKEVIREIPPEESIQMVEKILELAGLLVDERR